MIAQADPKAGYLAQKEEIDAAVAGVLARGAYILGPEVEAFEQEFASFIGAGFAVGVASGTDAITLALKAMGIGPGDGVATVSHTATATAAAIELSGATPVLVDVEADGFGMDPAALERLLQAPPLPIRAVVPVHLYGRPDYLPVDEAHPLRPVDINGAHKLAGETYHRLYHEVYGLEAAVLRLTNTYGPRMRVKDARQTFLGVWISLALQGRPFEVWGGEQLRDFSYVDDVVEALLLTASTPAAFGEVFNISGAPPLSLTATAELLAALAGAPYEVREFPAERRRIDIGDFHADDRKFRDLTGWAPRTGLEEGLKLTLDYFRDNLAASISSFWAR